MINIINGHELKIRKAKVEDASKIILLVRQVMAEAPFFPEESQEFNITLEQEEYYLENTSLFLVAEVDGKIVGGISLQRGPYTRTNHVATLGITILKEYCGLQIGNTLMKETIDWAKNDGIEKIELEVFEDNIPAINLYKKFGFIVEGRKNRTIKINDKYKDMLLMAKFLTHI